MCFFFSMQIIRTIVHENFPHKYANIMLWKKSGHFIIQVEQIFQSFRTAIKRMNQQWWVCETDVTANSVSKNGWLAHCLCLSAMGSEHEEMNKCTQKNSQTYLWIYIWVTRYKNISQCKHKRLVFDMSATETHTHTRLRDTALLHTPWPPECSQTGEDSWQPPLLVQDMNWRRAFTLVGP